MVTWHLSSSMISAKVEPGDVSGESGATWEIRVDGVSANDETIGSSVQWTDPNDNIAYTVAVGLKLEASAPGDPGSVDPIAYAEEAESVIEITVTEIFKSLKSADVSGNIDWSTVGEMDKATMNRYLGRVTGQDADSATTKAIIKKRIDQSGAVTDVYKRINVKTDKDGKETWGDATHSDDGITIRLIWNNDELKMEFWSDEVQLNDQVIEPTFRTRKLKP